MLYQRGYLFQKSLALFDNHHVSMGDISKKIRRIIAQADEKERFGLVRDIGWQMEKGLFNCSMELSEKYSVDEILNQTNASYILNDYGFTFISNGKEPFFSVFPNPEGGFCYFLQNMDELQKIFAALSSSDTIEALLYLYRQQGHYGNYVFEPVLLAKVCKIAEAELPKVIEDLILLRVIQCQEIEMNGKVQTLCYSYPSFKIIALFLIAQEIGYQGGYSLQSDWRTKPFLRNNN